MAATASASAAALVVLVLARAAGAAREDETARSLDSEREIRLQAAALGAAANAILIADRHGDIEYVNPAFTRVTGFEPGDVIGKSMTSLHPVAQDQDATGALWRTIRAGRTWHGELVNGRKDGSVYPEEQTVTPIFDRQGRITNFVAVKADITERKRHEAQLSYIAQHDTLTGLLNRAALTGHLEKAVAAAHRGRHGALLYLDLDHFKVVNDTLGHDAGDRLLVTLVGVLQANVRQEDVLARLGGDEFAILLREVTAEQAMLIAEKLRAIIGEFRFSEGRRVFDVDVSIGVACIDGTCTERDVHAHADMACYAAKSRGRNRVEAYRPELGEESRLSTDAEWSVRLKDALREDRFVLVFQPIVGVADGGLRHHEALIRLVEDGGIVSPGAFIPAAERFGLAQEIDRWVIRATFRRLRAERIRGIKMHVAINLSGLSFRDESVLDFIRAEIVEQSIDPSAVTFEITETAAITNLADARRFIESLRTLGCRFALDDFGSGFSSFAYLRSLPVDFVKIDGSFIRQLPHDDRSQVMVRSLNDLAHSEGIGTIAEFVEDEAILDTLRAIGVDFAQGYHVGHPSEQLVGV